MTTRCAASGSSNGSRSRRRAGIQLLTGPRQVGKTTLLFEIAAQFGDAAAYAAGDEPDTALPGFWQRRWADAEAWAQRGQAILLLDEVHHFEDWAKRLKGQWDHLRRRRLPVIWSRRGRPHCAWPRARARAWPGASNR